MRDALLAWGAAIFLAGCGQTDRVAGGNSSEVPNALDGFAFDPQGRPVAGATVRAMPAWAWSDSGGVSDSTRTDAQGRWSLPLSAGTWSILIQGSPGLSLRRVATGDAESSRDTLRSGAWISGTVGSGVGKARISVLGTSLFADADSGGTFLLGPVPGGILQLRLQSQSHREDVQVRADPGQVLSTGTWVSAAWGQESATLWPFARTAVLDLSSSGAAVTGDHPGFVVPVRLDSLLDVSSVDSTGIRFDDGTGSFYPRKLDWAGGQAVAWVRLDTANGNSAKHFLRVLWGRAVPVPGDMPAVFDATNGFRSAWHLDSADELSGKAGLRWTGSTSIQGVVGGGRQLSGKGEWRSDTVSLGGSESWTVSFWVRLDAKPSGESLLAGMDDGPDSTRWGLSIRDDMVLRLWAGTRGEDVLLSSKPLSVGAWTHLSATFEASTSRIGLVVDTAIHDRVTVKYPSAMRSILHGGAGLSASFDELRLSDVARDVHWSQLERQTQVRGGVPWIRW